MLLLASTSILGSSFVFPSQQKQKQHQIEYSIKSPSIKTFLRKDFSSVLYQSSKTEEEEDEPLSDELSKLIGKRASISKKTPSSSTSSKPIPSDNDTDAIIDPSFEALYEGKTGMDMFEMPDFKTERPLKTPKETEDKARGGEKKEDSGSDEFVDFMADYDDENDLHIPNRIGVSTDAWGDVDQGFKSGKKLKKKEIKAGKYLAGDLQVRFKSIKCIVLELFP